MSEFDLDALFESYAEEQEKEAKLSKGNGANFQKTYENIAWTGLDTNEPKIIRVVGGPPDSEVNNYTAKTCTIAWVTGDDGKRFKLIRPSFSEDPDYIINRIISKVNGVKWVNNTKTYPVRDSHPEIYNKIEKNGLQEGDKRYIFDKGWRGKEVLIMNVIDRSQMDWHRANKHTMLLAKSVTESDGNEFVDEGVSSFCLKPKFTHLFRSYGSWEKYDIAITKTSLKDNPYNVVNASNSPREVSKAYQSYIVTDEFLSDEEKSWEKYDISKFYKPTSVIKIYNRLKETIKKIDYALGTDFLKDLEKEVEAERRRLESEKIEEEIKTSAPAVAQTTPAPATRTTPTRRPVVESAPVVEYPEYFDTLSDDIKALVKSCSKDASGTWTIEWNCPIDDLAGCPVCGVASPLQGVDRCPVCGEEF